MNMPGVKDSPEKRLLTVAEAAAHLGCGVANIYGLINSGELPFVRIGRRKGYRVDVADLDQFICDRKEQKVAASSNRFRGPQPNLKHIRLSR